MVLEPKERWSGGVSWSSNVGGLGFCWLNTNSIYTRVTTDSFNDYRDPFPLLANYAQAIPSFPVQVFEL
jgi:hypothetical protein